jgi:Bacterial Ig-like domain (group 3)
MPKNRYLLRYVAAPLAVAVTTGGSVLLSGVANAAPPPGSLGTITAFDPADGTNLTIASVHTSGGCPNGGDAVFTDVSGPVGSATPTFDPAAPFNITTATQTPFSSTDPMDIPWDRSMQDAANTVGKPLQPGEYDFTTHCVDSITLEEFGTFTGSLTFTDATHYTSGTATPTPTPVVTPPPTPVVTPSPTPVVTPSPTPTPAPGAQTTTTTLSATPIPLPFIGGIVILQAHVAPANATGTVQFKDGTTVIGSAPVFFGNAGPTVVVLPRGSHSITASFVPSNSAAFNPSTSAPPVNFTF